MNGSQPISPRQRLQELLAIPEGQRTDAQNAIQFVRSTPGITTALVGMKSADHVVENMQTALAPPLDEARYMRLYKGK